MFWLGFMVGLIMFWSAAVAVFLVVRVLRAYFERQVETQFHEDLRGY